MEKIVIYADGGCRGNQFDENIGSWAAILKFGENEKEISGTAINTTNNKMELMSCIKALEAIKDTAIPVEVNMDSQYVVQGMNEWIYGWIKKGWINSSKKPVENKDLWQQLHDLRQKFSDIKFIKCKGHSNDEGNNRADALVNKAMNEINI